MISLKLGMSESVRRVFLFFLIKSLSVELS